MIRALGDIAGSTARPLYRHAFYEESRRIINGCAEKLPIVDVAPMRARLAALEKLNQQNVPLG